MPFGDFVSSSSPNGEIETDTTTAFQVDSSTVTLDEVAKLLRRHLRLDAVCIAEVRGTSAVLHAWEGLGGLALGTEIPIGASYLDLLLSGAIPNLIPDAALEPLVAELPLTRWLGVRSYFGVPLRLSDGTSFGMLAGVRCSPGEPIEKSAVIAMTLLAELVQGALDNRHRRDQLRQEVADLIEHERITLAYQPIIEVSTGRCLGLEALSRFGSPFFRPDAAFAAARAVGLGLELERLAVIKAWEMLTKLAKGQFLSVNVSPSSLVPLAARANERFEVALDQVVVEITENAIVEGYDRLKRLLDPLRRRGLRLAVDDVGAGYASLHHVVELRPDFIKLDISLVRGVAFDRARRVAVSSFAELAHELGATVIAEGVETSADLDTLRSLGVSAAQGYLLGRPSGDEADLSRWTSGSHRVVPDRRVIGRRRARSGRHDAIGRRSTNE